MLLAWCTLREGVFVLAGTSHGELVRQAVSSISVRCNCWLAGHTDGECRVTPHKALRDPLWMAVATFPIMDGGDRPGCE